MSNKLQLDFLKDLLIDIFNNNEVLYDDLNEVKSHIINTMKLSFDDVNIEQIEYNLPKLIKFNFQLNINDGTIIHKKDDIQIPEEYKDLVNHVEFIANLPQPEQRTKEWFDMRKNMITASCAAQAIGENPYSGQKPDDLILDKLDLGAPYKDNKFVHHGKKYEEIATKIYEYAYDIKVEEYGLVPHISKPIIPFIGASPDGIGSKYNMRNGFSPMIGRMLEIKCPFSRNIKCEGDIDGEICPHYYHCQVQQQLECCDLEYCDFWQCTIKEFDTKEDMFNDDTELNYKQEQNEKLNIPINCRMGCIIQLSPKNKITRFCLFDSKYIYPPDINMTSFEYDQWLLNEITHLHSKYPDLMDEYVFDRVLYWKLTVCHNVVIKRDRKWFKSKYILFKELWDRIVLYRSNKEEKEKFIKEKNKRRKNPIVDKKNNNNNLFIDSESSEDS